MNQRWTLRQRPPDLAGRSFSITLPRHRFSGPALGRAKKSTYPRMKNIRLSHTIGPRNPGNMALIRIADRSRARAYEHQPPRAQEGATTGPPARSEKRGHQGNSSALAGPLDWGGLPCLAEDLLYLSLIPLRHLTPPPR